MSHLRFYFILILVISALTINAQDQKAKEILDKVSTNNKSYKTILAEFNFTRENLQDKTSSTSKGRVEIKGNKYKLDLMGTESYFDGKTLWSFIKDANEVNVTEPDQNEESTINPAKLFSMYESGFKYRFITEKTENGKNFCEIELYPVDISKEFIKIILLIDKEKMQISNFKRYDRNGVHYSIDITRINYNNDMNDSMFIFDKKTHPKAQVNDMR